MTKDCMLYEFALITIVAALDVEVQYDICKEVIKIIEGGSNKIENQ